LNTDWAQHLISFAHRENIKTIVEFGIGAGTRSLISNFEKVHSIEIVSIGFNDDEWFKKFEKEFRHFRNWTGEVAFVPKIFTFVEHMMLEKYEPIAGTSKEVECHFSHVEIIEFLEWAIPRWINRHYDAAFVDPGIHFRGELVNALFPTIDCIFAHDTRVRNIYGWTSIKVPSNFEEFDLSGETGMGTKVWKRKFVSKNIILKGESNG